MNRNVSECRDKLQYFAMHLILLNDQTTVTPKNIRAQKVKSWPQRASALTQASALTIGLCLRMDMTLMLGVGCTGTNQCEPLQASMLTLGVIRRLKLGFVLLLCK